MTRSRKDTTPASRAPSSQDITPNELELLRMFVRTKLHEAPQTPMLVEFGTVRIDFDRLECYRDDRPMQMSSREFRLLLYFLQNESRVVSRDDILKDVWDYDAPPETRSVDTYVLMLRKKIEPDPASPQHIHTIRGAGYKFTR